MDHFDGLVAGYKCDGNTDDFSGNDRHATAIGSTFTSPGKIFAQAALHSGVNQYWDLPAIGINQDNQAFSILHWVNFSDAIGNYEIMIANGSGAVSQINKFNVLLRREADGRILFLIGKAQVWGAVITSVDILLPDADTDYHVGATYDGSRTFAGMKFFFAGSEITDFTTAGSFDGSAIAVDDWFLANASTASSQDMKGKQNQMLLYNKDVSAARILDLYNDGDGLDFSAAAGRRRRMLLGRN